MSGNELAKKLSSAQRSIVCEHNDEQVVTDAKLKINQELSSDAFRITHAVF